MTVRVPVYGLYGEDSGGLPPQWIHWETVPARSRLHGYAIRPHRHASLFQLLHITDGEAEVWLEGTTLRPPPPFALTVPSGTTHGFRFSEDVAGSVVTVVDERLSRLLPAMPAGGARFTAAARLVPLGEGTPAREVRSALGRLRREYGGTAPARHAMIEASLIAVLAWIERADVAGRAADAARDGTGGHAARFSELVERHFREDRRVAFYAERLMVSPTHLGRLCRKAFRASPLAIINRRVVIEAQRSLVFTGLGIGEIAGRLGFVDPAYFTRLFTRETGLTPTEYRRRFALGGGGYEKAPPTSGGATEGVIAGDGPTQRDDEPVEPVEGLPVLDEPVVPDEPVEPEAELPGRGASDIS